MPLPATTVDRQRTPGYLLRITFLDGTVTQWISATLEESLETENEPAASSRVQQRVSDIQDASFELEFYNGSELNNANVQLDSGIESFDVKLADGSMATMLPADFFTRFPVALWKIVKKTLKLDRKSGRVTVSCTPGHVDLSPPV